MSAVVGWAALSAALVVARPGATAEPSPSSRRASVEPGGWPRSAIAVAVLVAIACIGSLGVRSGVVATAVFAPFLVVLVSRLRRRGASLNADPALPFALDLAAAALRAGQPVSAALAVSMPAAAPATAASLGNVSGLLKLGAEPREAWRVVADDPELATVARVALRSSASGIRLAGAFELVSDELRARRHSQALARAHRAGALALLPLGLCFLPAFVCIGVVPVVLGIAHGAFGTFR